MFVVCGESWVPVVSVVPGVLVVVPRGSLDNCPSLDRATQGMETQAGDSQVSVAGDRQVFVSLAGIGPEVAATAGMDSGWGMLKYQKALRLAQQQAGEYGGRWVGTVGV